MRIVDERVALLDLRTMAQAGFGDLVKAVVDVDRGVMAVDGGLHSDEEALLKAERVEFDSVINIRPSHGNRSRGVADPAIRDRILEIVTALLAE
jgi:hypothetical protein